MRRLRFNHWFVILLGLSACAGLAAPETAQRFEPNIQAIFAPVAAPARWVGLAARRRLVGSDARVVDNRPLETVRQENDQLAQENARLNHEINDLRQMLDERRRLGENIWKSCKSVAVVGADSGNRDSIAIAGSTLDGLRDGMCVLYSGGIVGTLQRSGIAGGQVQLVTNTDFKATAYFSPYHEGKGRAGPDRLSTGDVLVEGAGRGMLDCNMVHLADAIRSGLRPGDWALLEDRDWPPGMQGRRIGRVVSIQKRKDAPLFADIRIRPDADLKKLREVMVLTRP